MNQFHNTTMVRPFEGQWEVLKWVRWKVRWKVLGRFANRANAEICADEVKEIILEARRIKKWKSPTIGSMGRRWAKRHGESVEHRFYVVSSDGMRFGPDTRERVDAKKSRWIARHNKKVNDLAKRREKFKDKYGFRSW